MKIRVILENLNHDRFDDGEPVSYERKKLNVTLADLNSLQLRTLNRIANGAVTVDTASDREFEVMEDLHALGLLNDEYELSDAGNAVLNTTPESEPLSSSMRDDVDSETADDEIVDDEFEELEDFSNDVNLR